MRWVKALYWSKPAAWLFCRFRRPNLFVRIIRRIVNAWAANWECNCEWVHPYGFVREAGCPRHDKGG